MLIISQLLQAISPEQPCGEDLSYSDDMDRIAHARQQDDPALDQGVWVSALKQADWPYVAHHCASLLEKRSKDLRLGVWLAEALAVTQGARGLGDGLAVLAGLCEHYWEGLFPLAEDDDFEQRCGNLRWLLGRVPALLQQWQQVHGAVPHGDAAYCVAKLQQLEGACDAHWGLDGPSFSAARESLAVLAFQGVAPDCADSVLDAAREAITNENRNDSGAALNRQQALRELRHIAQFFRATEPHSPVAYLADKAAHWGELTLHAWLQEVINDGSQLVVLEKLLGVTRKE